MTRPLKDQTSKRRGRQISVYLTEPSIEWLAETGAAEGCSRSEVMERLVEGARKKKSGFHPSSPLRLVAVGAEALAMAEVPAKAEAGCGHAKTRKISSGALGNGTECLECGARRYGKTGDWT